MLSEPMEPAPAESTAVAGPPPRAKYRVRFQKAGDLRLVSHHDLMHCVERMFRRADLLTTPLILVGLYIGVVMIAGAWIGRRLIDRMTEKAFLRILEILLVVFGLQFLIWPSR